MAVFQISYDLNGRGKDYEALFDRIQSYPNWCRPLKSMWFVVAESSSYEIASHLEEVMDNDDQLVVIRIVKGDVSWTENLDPKVDGWFRSNLV